MKLYIVGSVASGKTTLARRISKITGIPCHHLDEVVHASDDSWGNRKRTPEERDAIFADILANRHYIMEDTGRGCFIEGMRQADTIIWLAIPPHVRRRRYFFAGSNKTSAWKSVNIDHDWLCSNPCSNGPKIMIREQTAQKRGSHCLFLKPSPCTTTRKSKLISVS